MNLDNLASSVHDTSVSKGFWQGYHESNASAFICMKLALIHSEVTEVLEAIRKNKGEDAVMEEIADILIRTLDLYAGLNEHWFEDKHSLQSFMDVKTAKNKDRPQLHGNNF